MSRGLVEVPGCFVSDGLVDNTFPLTPALSLGERETWGSAQFKVPVRSRRRLPLNHRAQGIRASSPQPSPAVEEREKFRSVVS